MILEKWDNLPDYMKNDEVLTYYKLLEKKKCSLVLKRILDILLSSLLILLLAIPMVIIAIVVKIGSDGPVFFRQKRVTVNGKIFKILKFRTMVKNADKLGGEITETDDKRITKNGVRLRKYRLDELPQVFNVFVGDMSMVGTRPEVIKYVNLYTPEMYATLLMPAGITSLASINYRDEDELFKVPSDIDKNYLNIVLPEKMVMNLEYIKKFSLFDDIVIMFKTISDVF